LLALPCATELADKEGHSRVLQTKRVTVKQTYMFFWFCKMVAMEAWRDWLMAFREQLLEDDNEDDVMMNIIEGSEGSEGSDSSPEVVPCGSMPGRACNIDRERHMGHERMFADYFVDFRGQSRSGYHLLDILIR
jgi:hypothetical protein